MPGLFELGNAYLRQSDWKELALVKLCLFSMGILTATHLPLKSLPRARRWARSTFIATYVPLMTKFFRVAREEWRK